MGGGGTVGGGPGGLDTARAKRRSQGFTMAAFLSHSGATKQVCSKALIPTFRPPAGQEGAFTQLGGRSVFQVCCSPSPTTLHTHCFLNLKALPDLRNTMEKFVLAWQDKDRGKI